MPYCNNKRHSSAVSWIKGTLAALAVLLLLVPVLGCGASSSGEAKEATSERQSYSAKTLSLAIGRLQPLFPNTSDPNSDPSVRYAEKELKLDLDIVQYPETGYLERLNASMMSDQPPDLVHLDSSITISKYVKDGLIMPIDDLLKQHAPDLLRQLPKEAWDAVTFQGQIYAVPSLTEVPADEILYARKDWLDNLQLEPPQTLDEYYQVMRAFTYDDPDGNHKNDTFGLTILSEGLSRTGPFFGAFGVPRSADQIRQWKIHNDEVVYSSLLPETNEAIQFFAKLYGEGILDRDFVLNKEFAYTEKIISGQVGIYSALWNEAQRINQLTIERNPDARWIRLDYPVGKDGQQGTTEVHWVQAFNIIPLHSQNPEEAVKLLNFIAGEGHRTLKLGLGEEAAPTPASNRTATTSKYAAVQGSEPAALIDSEEEWGMLYALVDSADPAVRNKKLAELENGQSLIDNADYALRHVLRSDFTGPTTASMHRNADKLKAYEEEAFIKIIMGIEPEKDFEDFTRRWMSEGGWEISTEVNAWFRESRQRGGS